jgi:hypothetical protein
MPGCELRTLCTKNVGTAGDVSRQSSDGGVLGDYRVHGRFDAGNARSHKAADGLIGGQEMS